MKSKIGFVVGVLIGAAAGGASVWYYVKDKYESIAQAEIDSVKNVYFQHEQNLKKELQEARQMITGTETEDASKEDSGDDIAKMARRISEKRGYTEYSRDLSPEKTEAPSESGSASETAHVIAPYEFGELQDFVQASLTYFADGILADEDGVIVENVEETVGDALKHFGEFEDDAVHVRNEAVRCDYEILKSPDTFDDFLDELRGKGG